MKGRAERIIGDGVVSYRSPPPPRFCGLYLKGDIQCFVTIATSQHHSRTVARQMVVSSIRGHAGKLGDQTATKEQSMKALAIGLLTLASSLSTFAQELPLGRQLEAVISFCTTAEEAQSVVQAHKERGLVVASRMVRESQTCDTQPVGFVMKQVVSSTKVGSQTVYIVKVDIEMADDSWKPFYAMLITGGGAQEV